MKKVYIVEGNNQYKEMFRSMGYAVVSQMDLCDIVCFTGGSDVSPNIYGDKEHPFTSPYPWRDLKEAKIFKKAVENGLSCVGICRGAQFLNVMSGGRMYQHVKNHTSPHYITDKLTGLTIYVSSTHHQMMMPDTSKSLLVASSTLMGEREWYDGDIFRTDVSQEDIEVVYYEHTKSLCFQPHPEFNSVEYEGMRQYFAELMQRFNIGE